MTEGSPYGGMTVNERLIEAGLLEEFDTAILARDRKRAIEVLKRVDMGDLAKQTVDTVLRNPKRYGY